MKVAIQVLRCKTLFKLKKNEFISKVKQLSQIFLHVRSDNVKHCQYLDHTNANHVDAAGDPLAYWNGTLTIRLIHLNLFNIDFHKVYQNFHFILVF